MSYTITLYKFILEDTKQMIIYWEVETEKETKRFSSIDKAYEYVRTLNV